MKKSIKILIAAAGMLVVAIIAGIVYHSADVKANGFENTVYEICLDEEAELVLKSDGKNFHVKAADDKIIQLDAGDKISVVGQKSGETTVIASRGLHSYKCRVKIRDHVYTQADCVNPKTCELCNSAMGNPLGHDFLETACMEPTVCKRCGETGEPAGHEPEATACMEPAVCKKCGEPTGEILGHDFADATCTKPAACKRCGETEGEALGHDLLEAKCMEFAVCKRCGETANEPLQHDFSEATCTAPAVCRRCNQTEGKALGHDFAEPDCTKPSTCRRCGLTEGSVLGHNFAEADCEHPSTCRYCGLTKGEALGHDYTQADCKQPATCRRCKKTTGSTLQHNYQHIENGTEGNQTYDRYRCSVCNDEYTEYHAAAVSESVIYNAMMSMQASYPEGTRWTNDNFYAWNGGIYSGGYGCAGFAFMLSDAAFGSAPAKIYNDSSAVRVGDIARMNGDTHSVIILEVYSDSVIVAEGNYNSSVHWGRKISRSELSSASYFITRY